MKIYKQDRKKALVPLKRLQKTAGELQLLLETEHAVSRKIEAKCDKIQTNASQITLALAQGFISKERQKLEIQKSTHDKVAKMSLEDFKLNVQKSLGQLKDNEGSGADYLDMDANIVSIIEACLNFKMQYDLPELNEEIKLLEGFSLSGPHFSIHRGEIVFIKTE